MNGSEYKKYREKVFNLLKDKEPGFQFYLRDYVQDENRELFIKCVKEFIDTHPNEHVHFNQSYTKVSKVNLINPLN